MAAHQSHPIWMRGLKYIKKEIAFYYLLSHPIWMRVLKCFTLFLLCKRVVCKEDSGKAILIANKKVTNTKKDLNYTKEFKLELFSSSDLFVNMLQIFSFLTHILRCLMRPFFIRVRIQYCGIHRAMSQLVHD